MLIKLNPYRINSFIFILAVIFISVDGFTLFPIETEYRSLSLLIIPIYFILEKHRLNYKFHKYEINTIIIFFILWLYTAIKALISYNDFSGIIKFSVTGILSITTIMSCLNYFEEYLVRNFRNYSNLLSHLSKILLVSTLIPIFFGFFQLLGVLGIMSIDLSRSITSIISYRFTSQTRLQFANSEPASAAYFLGFVLLFTYFFSYNNKKSIWLFLLTICLLLTSSTAGFASLILSILIGFVLTLSKKAVSLLLLSLPLIGFFLFLLIQYSTFFLDDYTYNRISSLNGLFSGEIDYFQLIMTDFSVLDRTFSPIIPFYTLIQTYGLGAGGESFKYIYSETLINYFPELMNNPIIADFIAEGNLTTPKFLLSKLIGDFGIIGGGAFLYFIYYIFKHLSIISKEDTLRKIALKLRILTVYVLFCTQLANYSNFSNILGFTIIFYFTWKYRVPTPKT